MTFYQFVQEFTLIKGSLGLGISTSLSNMECFQNIHCLAHLYHCQSKSLIAPEWIGFPCTRNINIAYMPDMVFTNYTDVVSVQHKFRHFKPATQELIRDWNINNKVDILHLGVASDSIYINQQHSDTNFKLWIQNYQYVNMDLTHNEEALFKAFLNYKEYCNTRFTDINYLIQQNPKSIATIFNNNPMSEAKKDFINTFTNTSNILNE